MDHLQVGLSMYVFLYSKVNQLFKKRMVHIKTLDFEIKRKEVVSEE